MMKGETRGVGGGRGDRKEGTGPFTLATRGVARRYAVSMFFPPSSGSPALRHVTGGLVPL